MGVIGMVAFDELKIKKGEIVANLVDVARFGVDWQGETAYKATFLQFFKCLCDGTIALQIGRCNNLISCQATLTFA